MKVLKAIIRVILIIITSVLITSLVLTVPITKIAFNQNEVEKVIDNSNIYKNVSKEIKEDIIESLNESLLEAPVEVRNEIDVENLVNEIEIDDLLKTLTNEVIDIVYTASEEEITVKDIVNKYVTEFDKYIEENNIEIDQEILDDIHSSLSDGSLDEVLNDEEINETLKNVKTNVDEVKDYSRLSQGILVVCILVLTGFILLLSNNKVRSSIALLAIPIVLLGLIEGILSLLIIAGKEDMGELLYGIVSSLKNSFFKYVNTSILIFILVIIVLIILKIVKGNKKEKEEIKKEVKQEEEVEIKKEVKEPVKKNTKKNTSKTKNNKNKEE